MLIIGFGSFWIQDLLADAGGECGVKIGACQNPPTLVEAVRRLQTRVAVSKGLTAKHYCCLYCHDNHNVAKATQPSTGKSPDKLPYRKTRRQKTMEHEMEQVSPSRSPIVVPYIIPMLTPFKELTSTKAHVRAWKVDPKGPA